MMRKAWGILSVLVACAACHDATVIVGRVRVVKPTSASDAGAQPTSDGAAGAAGMQPLQTSQPMQTLRPKLGMQPKLPRAPVSVEAGTRDQFCAGHGGAVKRAGTCAPIERELFRYALCTCSDLRIEGDSFSADAYDASRAAYASPGQGGAAIGVNGALYPLAPDIQLGGSLTVTGSGTLSIVGPGFNVRGDLKTSAPVGVTTTGVHVARDAWFGAKVAGPDGSIIVGREAYLKPGVVGGDALQGHVQAGDFTLASPCACDPASVLDVPAIVAMAHALADNDAANFAKDSLKNLFTTSIIPVPCGRLVLSEISADLSTFTLTVTGRTALFVEGDMVITNSTFGVTTNPGAEIDLFISGNLTVSGTNALGASPRPSATRIYVGGQVSGVPTLGLAAALYAPHAKLVNQLAQAYGALVVDSLSSSGALAFHYDRSILDTAPSCSSAGQACESCEQCAGGLACVNGSCGACAEDSDCCEPFSCVSGRCGPLNVPAP